MAHQRLLRRKHQSLMMMGHRRLALMRLLRHECTMTIMHCVQNFATSFQMFEQTSGTEKLSDNDFILVTTTSKAECCSAERHVDRG